MKTFSCNIDLSQGKEEERFCCKLIDLNNDPDAVCSSSSCNSYEEMTQGMFLTKSIIKYIYIQYL